MAIQYPSSGSIFYTQFAPTSVQAILDSIKNALVSCGWTSVSIANIRTLTFSSNPTNGQTTTIAGKTYRYVTALAGCSANDVLIGATASNTAQNLNDAINASVGSGTEWCASTTANGNVTSTVSGTTLTITGTSTGSSSGAGFTISGTGTAAQSQGNGYAVTMPATPQFLQATILLENIPGTTTYASIRAQTADGSFVSGSCGNTGVAGVMWIATNGARTLEFSGNGHQFMVFMLTDFDTTQNCVVFFTVPSIRPHNTGTQITAATNASPIVITATGHGLSSGQDVYIAGVVGNTAANGFFSNITVVDANTISLPGTSGSGAYTSGGVLAGPQQIARCWLLMGSDQGTARGTYRSQIRTGNAGGYAHELLNQWAHVSFNSASPAMQLPGLCGGSGTNPGFPASSWGSIPDLVEPRIAWAVVSDSSTIFVVGQLWAAFCVAEPIPGDRLNTGFDGHNWINICNNSTNSGFSLWFAKT